MTLSAGTRSELVKAIIEKFCERFAPGGDLLYVGDTGHDAAVFDAHGLEKLGMRPALQVRMPDVVVHHGDKDWLFLVEAVSSHGCVNEERRRELLRLFEGARPWLVMVTAFPSRKAKLKCWEEISWGTVAWVAEAPDHLIHFDGQRFLGPHP